MVPKINVYLPDDLAEAVKEIGVPVSAICQRALEASVRRVTAVRQATLSGVNLDDPAGRMSHFTKRSRAAVGLAVQASREQGLSYVGTEHLLAGILAEGGNLAIEVLRAMEIEPEAVRQALTREALTTAAAEGVARESGPAAAEDLARESGPAAGHQPGQAEAGREGQALRFSGPAANALELAVTEAIGLGHNYVGCEHLLLGLTSEEEGAGGRALRSLGAEYRPTRRAVSAALVGYTYIQAQKQEQAAAPAGAPAGAAALKMLSEAVRREMQPFIERLDRLEQRLGPDPDPDSPAS